MARETDRNEWQVTTDREQIRDWAGAHDAVPVRDTGSNAGVDLRTDHARSGDQIGWEQFFERLGEERAAVRFRADSPDESERAAFEVVDRETVAVRDSTADRDAAEEKVDEPTQTESTNIVGSDTGEGEPPIFDEVETDPEPDADDETSMAESAHGAELSALVLDEIYEDPGGVTSEPEDEYLVFKNTAEEPLDLTGWTVENDAGRSYTFPSGFTLEPGERVTLHSGVGDDTETDLYWGTEEETWDQTGDTVTVQTANGKRALREPYKA